VALPSLLYGVEVIHINEGALNDLDHWQNIIGKSALQVRTSTANKIVHTDLGLKPIRMQVWDRKLKYFIMIDNPDSKGSAYLKSCLDYHKSLGHDSPYMHEIMTICEDLKIDYVGLHDHRKPL
jgi:hypothetical protein